MSRPTIPSTPAPPPDAALQRKKSRRLRLRIAFWSVFLLCALFLYLFYIRRPVGSGPAGPTVPRAGFDRAWTRRPTLLLGLGDSVTEGYGASAGKGYFDRLFANPPDEFQDMRGISLSTVLPELAKLNRAVPGSTSLQHMKWQVENLPVELDWWKYGEHRDETCLSWAYVWLNALYLLLGVAGLWLRPKFWLPMLAYMLLRSALLTNIAAPEARYTLECFPMLFALGGIALYRLTRVVLPEVFRVKTLSGKV